MAALSSQRGTVDLPQVLPGRVEVVVDLRTGRADQRAAYSLKGRRVIREPLMDLGIDLVEQFLELLVDLIGV